MDSSIDIFKESLKQVYMQLRMLDNLAIDIKIPDEFNKKLIIPPTPTDIKVLLTLDRFDNEKFANVHNMMTDYKTTFRNVTDLAKVAFADSSAVKNSLDANAKTFSGALHRSETVDDKTGMSIDTSSNTGQQEPVAYASSNDEPEVSLELESFVANGNLLNEAAPGMLDVLKYGGQYGGLIGQYAGLTALGVGSATLAAAGTFVANAAPVIAATYSLGYIGQLVFGNVRGVPHMLTNDSETQQETDKTTIASIGKLASDASREGRDTIASLDSYITGVGEVVRHLTSYINEDANSDFAKIIKQLLTKDVEKVKGYVHDHSGLIKQIDDENEVKREKQARYLKAENQATLFFAQHMSGIMHNLQNKPDDLKIATEILHAYNTPGTKADYKRELSDALSSGWEELKDVYTRHLKALNNSKDVNVYGSALNEAQETVERPVLDLDEHYHELLTLFQDYADKSWPKGNKFNGYDKHRQRMQTLKELANNEIKEKIKIVCATMNNGLASLVDKVKQFFLNHPLQANYLEGVWARHYAELDERMERRLSLMADATDPTRIIGWFALIYRDVLPKLLATLFTYRYALMVLKEQGVYTYTPNAFKEDEKNFESAYPNMEKSGNLVALMYLYSFGKNFAKNNEKSFITMDDKGGYLIDKSNAPVWLSFLLMNLAPTAKIFNKDATNDKDFGVLLASKAFVESFSSNKSLFTSAEIVAREFAGVVTAKEDSYKAFIDVLLKKEVESVVRSAYTKVSSIRVDEDLLRSFAVLSTFETKENSAKTLENLSKNFEALSAAYEKYKAAKTIEEKKAIAKEAYDAASIEMPNEVVNNAEMNKTLAEVLTVENDTDYYAYLYNIYERLNLSNYIDGEADPRTAKGIQTICNTVSIFASIISSGILLMNSDSSITNMIIDNFRNRYTNMETDFVSFILTIAAGDEANIKAILNAVKDVDDNGIKEICKAIKANVGNPSESLINYNADNTLFGSMNAADVPGLESIMNLNTANIAGVKTLNEFLTGENKDSIRIVGKTEKEIAASVKTAIADPLVFIVKCSIIKNSGGINKESIVSMLNQDGNIIKYISDTSKYLNAMLQIAKNLEKKAGQEKTGLNDEDKVLLDGCKNSVNDANRSFRRIVNAHSELKLDAASDAVKIFNILKKDEDVDTIISNMRDVKFDGKPLKDYENPYEQLYYLYKVINDAVRNNFAWKNLEAQAPAILEIK